MLTFDVDISNAPWKSETLMALLCQPECSAIAKFDDWFNVIIALWKRGRRDRKQFPEKRCLTRKNYYTRSENLQIR